MASASRCDHEVKVVVARKKFARLVNAAMSAVAATRNVSDGLNALAWSLPISEGDNIVLTDSGEHPNNVYPWLRQKRRGCKLRMVKRNPDGSINTDAMVEAMDERTRILTCSSVSYSPGHRADINRLGESCRARDVFFLVDGVQSAGILHHDFSLEPIDGFATSTSKGLLGLYGFGFLYIRPNWIDRLEPAYLSRSAIHHENGGHSAMGDHDYRLYPDSRRFEVGSYNLAGAYAAEASLDLLLGLGTKAIENHVLDLATHLHEGLSMIGIRPAVESCGPKQS
ncbi:MAG: aminotransferase class V-fold PLP-dependent enzyme, partial [Hyphomicrobiales bacterium]